MEAVMLGVGEHVEDAMPMEVCEAVCKSVAV
jgi:hypothetical protein